MGGYKEVIIIVVIKSKQYCFIFICDQHVIINNLLLASGSD